mmetsp:Transcript_15405/g.35256  ORF Transcript_15405/g.35256 Transcript_15405/m.35256 type:complete len:556 (-) Transcript_15405:1075-2742(-)
MSVEEGAEYNFAYVMPQAEGEPVRIVIPTQLQMGWTESPSYFCAATETARDIAEIYAKADKLEPHYLEEYTKLEDDFKHLPSGGLSGDLAHCFEVFVDDFIGAAIPRTKEDLTHLSRALLHAIHDIFPASPDDPENDPESLKKLKKREGAWAVRKDILGWELQGKDKTVQLDEGKYDKLMTLTKEALRSKSGMPFNQYEKMLGKMRHASWGVPGSNGLFTPFNRVIAQKPKTVWFRQKSALTIALRDWRSIFKESLKTPTHVRQLVRGEPNIAGIVDASGEGVGGVIFGMTDDVVPTVFRFEWPEEVKRQLQTENNPNGTITNSDLEMAGLVFLWLMIEHVAPKLYHKHIVLLSDNSPSVAWIDKMASKRSVPAGELLRVLARRLCATKACPITPLHIPGRHNRISDIPSRSFGYKREWHFVNDSDFLTFFNSQFPLPHKQLWQMCRPSTKISSRICHSLLMPGSGTHDWRRLPTLATNIGGTGSSSRGLWNWILTSTQERSHTTSESEHSRSLGQPSDKAFTETVNRLLAEQLARQSPPLDRRSPWLGEVTSIR